MVKRGIRTTALVALMLPVLGFGQQPCTTGIRIDGVITDPTGAVIPGAKVQTGNGFSTVTDATGSYALSCVAGTSAVITAKAEGFASGTGRARGHIGSTVRVNVQLAVASVREDVQVNGDTGDENEAGTTVLNTQQIQQLPDDPDDLLR